MASQEQPLVLERQVRVTSSTILIDKDAESMVDIRSVALQRLEGQISRRRTRETS